MKNQSMHFVLSTDSKPRLRWTTDLHQRFIDAINQLGGADSKSNTKEYNESDGNSRTYFVPSQEPFTGIPLLNIDLGKANKKKPIPTTNNKVQKHLQLRIEAQGKYLQSVLTKAQEALCGHNSSPIGIKLTKDELSRLVTMVNNVCPSSPISELTETRGISLNCSKWKQNNETMCSLESSLTSSESSERKEEKNSIEEIVELKNSNTISLGLPLMAMHSEEKAVSCPMSVSVSRKRNAETKFDGSCVEESSNRKRCGNKLKKAKLSEEMFDLNRQCQNDMESTSSKILLLDLNCSLNFCEP
ncbi:hypothetical protein TSUD_220830 [Trifolium subterraneum]|uniref:MYB-CC type transcription factor LHEQLE-containing domain-containing protein n=1 Tax=Trifolium subterraneum TaxID=3900 RepID=A0A2Z6MYK4_TRISU|nr:hypothetical protein TSUD_220830 [Trifolium subterraneum]